MKLYPTPDVGFYVEYPNTWEQYCRYPANYKWKAPPFPTKSPQTMRYYRDYEGAKMLDIKAKDLHFKPWETSRLKPGVCLPIYYALGQRFIKLEQSNLLGYGCAQFPMNLKEVKQKDTQNAAAKKKAAKDAWFKKMVKAECRKASKKRPGS